MQPVVRGVEGEMAGFRRKGKPSPIGVRMAETQAAASRRLVPPTHVPAFDQDGRQLTFCCGYTVPPGGGRAERHRIGKDLGEIRVEERVITLRPLRQPPGRFLAEVYLTEDDVELASPIALDFVASNRGVALRLATGVGYVWIDQPAELLARLAEEGFATDDTPVAPRGIVG
jgi:hypothetical protein